MKRPHRVCVELSALVAVPALTILVTLAGAQTSASPSPQGPAPAGDMTGAMFVVAVMMALLTVGIAMKVFDRTRERRDEAAALQARIADALRVDPVLGHLPVTATTHAPSARSSPVTIEVRGHVQTPALREAAIALVMREAFDRGVRFRVEDRMEVDPSMFKHAA